MFDKIIRNTNDTTPIVHAITNYVTVNDCANIILACGGSPIMADDINEVEDITNICSSLVINMGTLNKDTVAAMLLAGKQANKVNHPVILDPVGAGASKWRNDCVARLLKEVQFAVIRGNISEIKAVALGSGTTKGVDANANDEVNDTNILQSIDFAKNLAKKIGAVISISGEIDIAADSEKAYVIKNGDLMMTKITGSGCMLTCVIGAYCGANPHNILDSTAAAMCGMGLSGQLALVKTKADDGGLSTFKMHLIDYMGKIDGVTLDGGAKIENY